MNIGVDITGLVQQNVAKVRLQLRSRAIRASNELRNAELQIMRGSRNGRSYVLAASGRKTKSGKISKRHYVASSPGEPPAVRTGTLRRSFRAIVTDGQNPAIESNVEYASYLENGTSKMAPRPYAEKTVNLAMPKIEAIYNEPWFK